MDELFWLLLISLPGAGEICCLVPLWLVVFLADVCAYYTSGPNRRERRDAQDNDLPPPPRDYWTWLFLILLGVTVLLFIVFVVQSIMLMNRIKSQSAA